MPRIDDYINARQIAVEELSKESFNNIAKRSGFETLRDNVLKVPFLDRVYQVNFPDFEFKNVSEKETAVPIQEQVLILHYLMAESTKKLTGNWVAYREIQGASFYFSAFVKRAIDPLKKVFGQNISGFSKASNNINGKGIDIGDVAFEFKVFPKVPLQLILWEGDDEFSPEANILFDETIGEILSPEDVAWLSGMLVYRLIALSRG
jgi:hypothetical protein